VNLADQFKLTRNSWSAMLARCESKADSSYCRYGGRGISVCERWHDFWAFIADLGPRPSSDHSLDRLDPNGGYEPSNCRWATKGEQARNRRPRDQWDIRRRQGMPSGRPALRGRWKAPSYLELA
jgi:hypothetical protein